MNNKIYVWLLGLILCSTNSKAAKWTDSGNYDASWYSDLISTFELSTPRQLAGLAYLINNGKNFSEKSIKIASNLDMNEHEWSPISSFDGVFDGDFHKISNLHLEIIASSADKRQCSFVLNNNGIIKNTMFDNVTYHVSSEYDNIKIGGVAASNVGGISNCIVSGNLKGEYNDTYGSVCCGGISSINEGIIENCSFIGNVTSLASISAYGVSAIAGGIAGENKGDVLNCINRSAVYASVGYSGSWHKLSYAYAGGIVGVSSGIINNVINSENVKAKEKGYAGAIVASNSGTVNNAYTHSSLIVEGPTIDNSGMQILFSQFNNETFDFTSLLNNNVTSFGNSELSFWCNSPEKYDNTPIIMDGFLIDAIDYTVNMNTVTLSASPGEIHSSAISTKGFAIKKEGEIEFRYINCQNDLTSTIGDLDFAADYTVCVFVKTIDGKTIYMRGVSFSTSDISVGTRTATNITACSATLNGYAPNGIMSVKAKGFRWRVKGTSEYNIVYASSDFAATVDNLFPDTNYEFQAFIQTTNDDMLYGETVNFITLPLSISINSNDVSYRTITLKGNINVNIVADIVIEYKKSSESSYNSIIVKSNNNGHFEGNLINLTPGTYYDYKATISHLFGNSQQLATTSVESCKTLDVLIQTLTPIIGSQTTLIPNSQVLLRGEANGGTNTGTVGFEMALNTDATTEVHTYLTTLEGTTFAATTEDIEKGNEYKYRAFYREEDYSIYGSWITFEIDGSVIDGSLEAYTVYKDSVLTFYYDQLLDSREGQVYKIRTGLGDSWGDNPRRIKTVIFDESFSKCNSLTSTAYWFYSCHNLRDIYGLENLNTLNVIDMSDMFSGCHRLSSINLSCFNTANVNNMSCMFEACKRLTTLNISNFNTSNVTDMGCMFNGCESLEKLDVSSFNTSNVSSMNSMFCGCNKLKTIYVRYGWSTNSVEHGGYGMFIGCSNLVGGAGTTFDENHTDYTYAHIDGGPSNPGYLTYKEGMEPTEREAYAVYKDSVLTFYYDNAINSREGDVYKSDKFRGSSNGSWGEKASAIKTVKFENSFSAYGGLTTTATWFRNCRLLTAIDGLENLNTTNVTDMKNMFRDCSSLTNLDLSGLSVVNVTNMQLMFYGCNNLTNLNLSRLYASNVTYMDQMFQGCSSLTNLNLSGFKTSNVTITRYMFSGCSSLTYLDLSGFSTAKVTDMRNMFSGCSNLRTIYVSNEWSTSSVNEGYDMFYSCTSLVGGAGTTYNGYNRDYTYAHIDGGPSNPGYMTGVGSEPETQTYEYHIVIWLNDGTKVEYKYDENLVIRCEVGKLSITTKNGIVDYALRNIKEITLSKKTEDGSIIPISPSETENAGIVIYKNNGSQIEITADRVKNIMLYMEKTHQGHGYTDLGLDTYWATCNIGADAPEGKGYYFSWGETQPKKTYDENTYKFGYPPAKYNDEDGLTQLLPADDAAHVYWGGQWRLPNRVEENELYNKCEWTWTNVNGVDGFTVTGPNGNSIFLPTTGLYDGDSTTELKRSNTGGWYWSSTTNGSNFACGICFPTPNNLYMNVPNHERWDGHAIRPVVNGADVSESFGIIIYLVDGSEIKIPREELDKITAYFVTSTIQGDVNGDVVVDVADIATIISVMAGDGVGTGHVPTQGDVNGDGVVDVADIATIISIMAGSTSDDDTEPENAIHPESPYDYVKGEIPNISESQISVTISTNAEALPGGAVIINASANTLIECFYIAISGQPGYYIKYPETPTPNGGNYIYRFPLLFPQDWDHDIVVKVCGLTKDGRFFVCQDLPIRYHAAGTGALQVSLTFDNAKDIDLHLFTPGGTHFYYGNKGYSKTYENGEVVYVGLDVDSNPGCNIDNINCENITLPEEAIEEGTYKVYVNMYSNCNTNIATGWTCIATRGGQIVSNQLTGYGNPASGVYPVGQRNHDMTEVMRFNVELTSAARAAQRKQYVITPIPLDDASIMKMEEEKARIGE